MSLSNFIISGGVSSDSRGIVRYHNSLKNFFVKRFYIIQNNKASFFRAWHGHKKEKKIVKVINGTAIISIVKIDNWKKPSKKLRVISFKINSSSNFAIFIPSGYANGAKTLNSKTKLIYFSNFTLSQSIKDDYRYPVDYWKIGKLNRI